MNRIRMLLMRNIVCRIFGHVITDVMVVKGTAVCGRCGYVLDIRYNLPYSEMHVVGVRYKTNKSHNSMKTKQRGEKRDK